MWRPETLYLVFIATGFTVGLGHCVGMCGPIVASLSLQRRAGTGFLSHLSYNGGRILTYTLLGGVVGMSGSFTGLTSRIAGVQKGILIFAGLLIIAMGLGMGGWIPFGKRFKGLGQIGGSASFVFQRLPASRIPGRYFLLGLLLGLLPCAPVYAALVATARAAMETESAVTALWKGMALMFCFGLGTAPALLLVGGLADLKWLRARSAIYKAGAVILVALGLYFVFKGLWYEGGKSGRLVM